MSLLTLSSLDVGWANRLSADATFASLVGLDTAGAVRLYRGWPLKLLSKPINEDLPRVTFFVTTRQPVTGDPKQIRLQSDIWVWPDVGGAMTLVDQIDERMLELLGGDGATTWFDSYQPAWISSAMIDGSDPPETILLRRRRLWQLAPGGAA